ncbi:hypothetical protein GALMADRAFT_446769 [Galerina marginata CBS 339.88]|uniref:Uncharacterized protein n=1 Tax=Galerina marginata (strain CBS 339.88) TaxID=685588 RepID=A0A067T033_GALM3|nr:hypothetical protein GALMADRAFT_446769 [Galerina marginata CBS 339.88]
MTHDRPSQVSTPLKATLIKSRCTLSCSLQSQFRFQSLQSAAGHKYLARQTTNPMNPASGQVVGSTPGQARWSWTHDRAVKLRTF